MSCKVLMGAALAVALLATSPNAVAQTSPGSSDVDFRPADAPSTASPTVVSAPPTQPVTRFQQVRAMIDAARTEDAVLLCDRLLNTVNAVPPGDSCLPSTGAPGDLPWSLLKSLHEEQPMMILVSGTGHRRPANGARATKFAGLLRSKPFDKTSEDPTMCSH